MNKRIKNKNFVNQALYEHIQRNIIQYFIISSIFIVSIIIGVLIFNSLSEGEKAENVTIVNDFITNNSITNYSEKIGIFRRSIYKNIVTVLFIWLTTSSFCGIFAIYLTISTVGFSFGYTMCTIQFARPGIFGGLFSILTLLPHYIVIIPTIFVLAINGINFYKFIFSDTRREKIKGKVLRIFFCYNYRNIADDNSINN